MYLYLYMYTYMYMGISLYIYIYIYIHIGPRAVLGLGALPLRDPDHLARPRHHGHRPEVAEPPRQDRHPHPGIV